MFKVDLGYTVSSRPARAQEKVEGGRGREMRSGKYVSGKDSDINHFHKMIQ